MGKRKRSEKDSFENLAKKVKKLKRKMKRKKRTDSSSSSTSSSSSDSSSCASTAPKCYTTQDMSTPARNNTYAPPRHQRLSSSGSSVSLAPHEEPSTRHATYGAPAALAAAERVISKTRSSRTVPVAPALDPLPGTSRDILMSGSHPASSAINAPTEAPLPTTSNADNAPPASILDDEVLQILGEDPTIEKSYGKQIHPDLAVRLQHIATSGLLKEDRKELLERYLVPDNCKLIPTLNPEAKAAINEAIHKRDMAMVATQKQLAAAISCAAESLNTVLLNEPRNTSLVKALMDLCKMLCDIQHADSIKRRNFVLFSLKRELKEQLQSTKIDQLLFSKDLAETLKVAKSISKSGAEMKTATTKPLMNKDTNKQPQKHLNWRPPSPNHRSRGTQRIKGPSTTYKRRRENSSKQSLRRP